MQQTDADLSAVAELDSEHEAMREALGHATQAMVVLRATPSTAHAVSARAAVAHLGEVPLNHLSHEERDLEPISAAYQDAPSMKAALRQVKKAHLKSMGNFDEWLQDGADAADLAGMRKELPPPVISLLGKLAGRRYRREIAPTWKTTAPTGSVRAG